MKKKIIRSSDIAKCGKFILSPTHYRDDGSCRCNDEYHHEMKEWGYVWDGQKWQKNKKFESQSDNPWKAGKI